MFFFSEFLERSGISPDETRLVRHDSNATEVWSRGPEAFLCFASLQSTLSSPYRGKTKYAAHFLVGPTLGLDATAIFIGITSVANSRFWDKIEMPNAIDEKEIAREIANENVEISDLVWFETTKVYSERLLIDWGAGTRAWSQWANRSPKKILELRLEPHQRPFPGYGAFSERLSSISYLPESWKSALKSVKGIYLLVSPDGQQYVGSAYGEWGFWGRWSRYAENGHGGNAALKALDVEQRNFWISILEVASPEMSANDIIAREAFWKSKLGTRAYGLNRN